MKREGRADRTVGKAKEIIDEIGEKAKDLVDDINEKVHHTDKD